MAKLDLRVLVHPIFPHPNHAPTMMIGLTPFSDQLDDNFRVTLHNQIPHTILPSDLYHRHQSLQLRASAIRILEEPI